MIAQLQVGTTHDVVHVRPRVEDEHGVHAFGGRARARGADDRGLAHPRLRVQRLLDVFGKDIQSFRRDDHFLLAAPDAQLSAGVELADVAGVKPAVAERAARLLRSVEVAARHVLAADEDLAVVGDLDLDAGDRLADGALGRMERMVQRDDRRRLGEAVTLNDDKAQASPERLELGIERGRADDDRPELESEHAMHGAIPPPARRPVHLRRRLGRLRRHAHEMVPQDLEDLGHAHQHRHAPIVDLPDDVVGRVAAREHHEAGQHRRDERSHRLSEHVAERQEVEESNREKRPGPLAVLRDLPLDRHDVGEEVPVGDDHALRVGSGAGREDDLRRVVGRQLRWGLILYFNISGTDSARMLKCKI